jgi:hypothetical protein
VFKVACLLRGPQGLKDYKAFKVGCPLKVQWEHKVSRDRRVLLVLKVDKELKVA